MVQHRTGDESRQNSKESNQTAEDSKETAEESKETSDQTHEPEPEPMPLSQLAIFARLRRFQKRHERMMAVRKDGEDKIRASGGIE